MKEEQTYHPYLPFLTLFKKELLRIRQSWIQTIVSPITTVALYLFIFGVGLGESVRLQEHGDYLEFIVPGLIVLSVVQNSFVNSSASLFMSRYLNYIIDYLVAPLSPLAMLMAFTLAAMLRGLFIGFCVYLLSLWFVSLSFPSPLTAVLFILLSSFCAAQLGVIVAIYSDNFDTLSLMTNFFIVPLLYLGGLFFPVSLLPSFWRGVSYANPALYLIDGFRGAAIGRSDCAVMVCITVTCLYCLACSYFASRLLSKPEKLQVR